MFVLVFLNEISLFTFNTTINIGLSIGRVHLTSCNNGAYVEFQNINDMEDALKCTEKKHDIRIYRSTKKMMFWCIKNESKYPFSSLLQHSNESSLKSPDSNYYLSIHGLPLEANEESILNMFPGRFLVRKAPVQSIVTVNSI